MILRAGAPEKGQAAPEYAVILALVAAVLVTSYQLLGAGVLALFQKVVAAF